MELFDPVCLHIPDGVVRYVSAAFAENSLGLKSALSLPIPWLTHSPGEF